MSDENKNLTRAEKLRQAEQNEKRDKREKRQRVRSGIGAFFEKLGYILSRPFVLLWRGLKALGSLIAEHKMVSIFILIAIVAMVPFTLMLIAYFNPAMLTIFKISFYVGLGIVVIGIVAFIVAVYHKSNSLYVYAWETPTIVISIIATLATASMNIVGLTTGKLSASAYYIDEAHGVRYLIYDNAAAVESFIDGHENVTIAERADGKLVERVSKSVSGSLSSVKTITFSSGITNFTIEDNAFSGAPVLESVILNGSGAFSIGGGAFKNCTNLTSVSFNGEAVYTLGDSFADNAKLASVTFSGNSSGNVIGDYAFNNCPSLTSVAFTGTGSYSIRDYSFAECRNISDFAVGKATVSSLDDGTEFYSMFGEDGTNSMSIDGGSVNIYADLDLLRVKSSSSILFSNRDSIATPLPASSIKRAVFVDGFDFGEKTVSSIKRWNDWFTTLSVYVPIADSIYLPTSITSIPEAFVGDEQTCSIYYAGTEEQWNALSKSAVSNDNLTNGNVTMHYNVSY